MKFKLILLIFPILSYSQIKIKGKIQDTKNIVIEYANVVLKKDSVKIIKTVITNSKGEFEFEIADANKYLLHIYGMGYKDYKKNIDIKENTDLGVIYLEHDMQMLNEMELSVKAPLIENVGDKLVVDVANSPFAKGRTSDQILNYTPFMRANKQEGITLMGESPIILINERRVYLSSEELLAMLESLPAEEIKSIDIYTNPPARFDAEGASGVINININKSALIGLRGNIIQDGSIFTEDMGGRKGIFQNYFGGLVLNYTDETWFFSTNLNGGVAYTPNLNTFNTKILDKGIEFDNYNNYQADFTGKVANFTIGRDITKDQNIVVNYSYNNQLNDDVSKYKNNETDNGNITRVVKGDINVYNPTQRHTVGLNYNWKINKTDNLIIMMDYYNNKVGKSQNIINRYYLNGSDTVNSEKSIFIDLPLTNDIIAGQFDYNFKTDFGKFGLGGKYTSTTVNSKTDYFNVLNGNKIFDIDRSIDFFYGENIPAIYISYDIGSLKLGMRYEYTNATYKDKKINKAEDRSYHGFFPNIIYTLPLFEKRDFISLSYNRRIRRPHFSHFNGLFYGSENQQGIGYSEIRPSFPNRIQLTYNLLKKYVFITDFVYTANSIENILYESNKDKNVILSQPRNINDVYRLSFRTNINQEIFNWWSLNFSANVSYNKMIGEFTENYNTIKINQDGISSNFSLINRFIFDGYNIELQSRVTPRSKYGIIGENDRYEVNFNVNKSFLDNSLFVQLLIEDIFKSNGRRFFVSGLGNLENFSFKAPIRFVYLTLRYNFIYGMKRNKEMEVKQSIKEDIERGR